MEWTTRNQYTGQQIAPQNEWQFTSQLRWSPPARAPRWSPPPHRVLRNPEGPNPFVQQSEILWRNFPEPFQHNEPPRVDRFSNQPPQAQFSVARRSIHADGHGQFNDVTWEQQQVGNYSGFLNETFEQVNNSFPNSFVNRSFNRSNSFPQEQGVWSVPPTNVMSGDGHQPYFTGNYPTPRPPLDGRRIKKAARRLSAAKKKNNTNAKAAPDFSHVPELPEPNNNTPNTFLVQIPASEIPEYFSDGQASTDDPVSTDVQGQAGPNPEVGALESEEVQMTVVPVDTESNASSPASPLPEEPQSDVNSRKRKRTDDEYLEALDKDTSEIVIVTQPFSTPSPRQPEPQKPRFESILAMYSGFWFGDQMPLNPVTPEKLYHYTTWEGCVGILQDRYIGLSPTSIIKFGFGIYFTKIPPDQSTEDIVYNNFNSHKESKYTKTEYCFEFLSADLPDLTFCIEQSSHYGSNNGRKDRDVWKSTVHRLYLDRTKGVYYRRELDGPRKPKFIELHSWDLSSQVPTSTAD